MLSEAALTRALPPPQSAARTRFHGPVTSPAPLGASKASAAVHIGHVGRSPAQFGVQWINLTGAPVLIEVGTKDGYDNGSGPCTALAASVNPSNGGVVRVNAYPGATHAWDRLIVPTMVNDPFADQGSYFQHRRTPGGAIYA